MSARALTWAWQQMPALNSTPEKLVLVALADRADDDGELYPKVEWVAEKVGLGKSTVRRHIASLEERALLLREERTRPTDKRQTSNLLRLALDSGHPPETGRPGRPELGGSPRPKLGGQETTSKETTKRDVRALEVHDFYSERRRVRRVLSAGTEKLIVRALNAGFNTEDLKLAVIGLLGSDWHRERGQVGLSVIFKTGPGTESFEDRINGFIDRGLRHQPNGAGLTAATVPDWVRKNLRTYRDYPEDAQAQAMYDAAAAWLEQRGLTAAWVDGKLTITRKDA